MLIVGIWKKKELKICFLMELWWNKKELKIWFLMELWCKLEWARQSLNSAHPGSSRCGKWEDLQLWINVVRIVFGQTHTLSFVIGHYSIFFYLDFLKKSRPLGNGMALSRSGLVVVGNGIGGGCLFSSFLSPSKRRRGHIFSF